MRGYILNFSAWKCLPLVYDIKSLKSRINRKLLSLSCFQKSLLVCFSIFLLLFPVTPSFSGSSALHGVNPD